jgi:hypothetical protein
MTWQAVVRRTFRPVLWVGTAAIVSGVLVLPWAVELAATAGEVVPQPQEWFQTGPKHLIADLLSDRAYGHPFDRNVTLRAVVVGGVVGIGLAWNAGNRAAAFVGLGGVWCLVVAYTFSYLPGLRAIQPYRFLVPAILCLAIPASVAADEAWRVFRAAPPSNRRLIAAMALVFGPSLTAYLLDVVTPPLHCGVRPQERAILDAVRNSDSLGRVICQPDTVGHLIPLWCRKPVIGGLNDQAFVKQRFAGMNEAGKLFGRPAAGWDEAELRTYLRTYAVDTAVFSGADWRAFAAKHPGLFEPVFDAGGMTLYRVLNAEPGFVLEGSASVTVFEDRIRVAGAGERVILKMHHSPLLKLPTGVTAEPVSVLDDPVPFLKLVAPAGLAEYDIFFR